MIPHSLFEESALVAGDARETSRLAALKVAPRAGTVRLRVLLAIMRTGEHGLTDDELSDQLHISPNTIRPRRVELVEGDWVMPGNREALSFYGNRAIAWVTTSKCDGLF